MDNLRLRDFLVGVRYFFCLSACILVMPDWQTTPANAAERPQLAQQTEPSPTANLQKVQRLLKLLADRHPDRYGSVDPGRLDGVYGKETKIAIRNFRKIAGVTKAAVPDDALYTAILAELTSMAAEESGNSPAPSQPTPTKADTTASGMAPDSGLNVAPDAEPAVPAVTAATPTVEKAANAAAPANAASTAAKTHDAATSAESTQTQTPVPAVLYFVQIASVRSIESASREWQRLMGANRVALEGEQIYVERAELRNRGIFHRILVGPMPTKEEAATLCDYLMQNDQTCVVTQRRSAAISKLDYRKLRENRTGKARPPLPWEMTVPASTAEAASPQPADASGPALASGGPAARDATTPPAAAPAVPDDPEKTFTATPTAETARDPAARPSAETPSGAAPPAETPTAPSAGNPLADSGAAAAPTPPALTPAAPTAATPDGPAPPAPTPSAGAAKPNSAGDPNADAAADLDEDVPVVQATESPAAGEEPKPKGGVYLSSETLTFAATAAVMLAIVLIGGIFFHRRSQRTRQPTVAISEAGTATGIVEASPLSSMEEDRRGDIESLAQLEEAFGSLRLRESRRVRDEFLRNVLDDDPDHPSEIHKRDSAIRVNGSLKELLATDPEQYKSIFLSLIFLSKVGAALNRHDIALEELNGPFSRELMLLQSYFKIHILELDDRHRIRQELPGLFYCLQLSQLQKRQGKRRFSAA